MILTFLTDISTALSDNHKHRKNPANDEDNIDNSQCTVIFYNPFFIVHISVNYRSGIASITYLYDYPFPIMKNRE